MFKDARKFIVSGLVLTCCVRPSWFSQLFIDGYKGTVRYRSKVLEIRDELLLFVIRHWYVLPEIYRDDWREYNDYSNMHKLTERQVRNIVKEVLGVKPKKARLACAANIACNEHVETASKYYDVATWYLRKLLRSYEEPGKI